MCAVVIRSARAALGFCTASARMKCAGVVGFGAADVTPTAGAGVGEKAAYAVDALATISAAAATPTNRVRKAILSSRGT